MASTESKYQRFPGSAHGTPSTAFVTCADHPQCTTSLQDLHPLSINLFADFARENEWDESVLLKVQDDDETSTLEKNYHQTLKGAVEPVFRSLAIQQLGTVARDALVEIAAFPRGVEECRLESVFPGIVGVGEAVDKLCRFSLIYRRDGFVKML